MRKCFVFLQGNRQVSQRNKHRGRYNKLREGVLPNLVARDFPTSKEMLMTTSTHACSTTRRAARTARAELRAPARKLSRDFRTLVIGAETLLRKAQSLSGEGAVAARSELERKMAEARARLEDLRHATAERTGQAVDSTASFIHRDPWTAVGIAIAAGVLLAMVATRRSPSYR